jgi:hypothetical protein
MEYSTPRSKSAWARTEKRASERCEWKISRKSIKGACPFDSQIDYFNWILEIFQSGQKHFSVLIFAPLFIKKKWKARIIKDMKV